MNWNFITRQTARWSFYNASDVDSKIYNTSDFGMTKNNALDFEAEIILHSVFEKNVCNQKVTFWFVLPRENDIFCIFRAWLEAWFWIEKFITSQILNWKKYNASDFEFEKLQRVVRFWVKTFTTSHTLNQLFKQASDFKMNLLQRVSFWL